MPPEKCLVDQCSPDQPAAIGVSSDYPTDFGSTLKAKTRHVSCPRQAVCTTRIDAAFKADARTHMASASLVLSTVAIQLSGSTARRPDKPCCPELAGLLESNPVCLCQLLAGGADSYGVSVDYKRALALPGICRLTAPPVSACAAFGVPVPMGPSASPMTGLSPSATGPQLPENPPSAAQQKSPNHAPGRFTAGGLIALAALPLAVTAAWML